MQLRNRAVGQGSTFYPFKRLPVEIRNMIWSLTLVPRVVRPQFVGRGENEGWHGDMDDDYRPIEITDQDIEFVTRAELPMALSICPDSRRAVLPYYPYCFASSTRPAGTRFNGNIDTLFIDSWISESLPILFGNMSVVEHSRIKYLTISDDDIPHLIRNFNTSEFCSWLDPELEKLSSLEEICVAISPVYEVHSQDPTIQRLMYWDQGVAWSPAHTMELFRSFPQELVNRYELQPNDIPTLDYYPNFGVRPWAWNFSLQDWVLAWATQYNLKFVWWMERDRDGKLLVWDFEKEPR